MALKGKRKWERVEEILDDMMGPYRKFMMSMKVVRWELEDKK